MVQENWRDVYGFDFRDYYEVSDLGRVRRHNNLTGVGNHRVLKGNLDNKGYWRVTLSGGGRRRAVGIHTLVAEAFMGRRHHGMEVNHRNGIKEDNRPSNLKYTSHAGNLRHAHYTGLVGGKDSVSKLTAEDRQTIKRMFKCGKKPKDIRFIYKLTSDQFKSIVGKPKRKGN